MCQKKKLFRLVKLFQFRYLTVVIERNKWSSFDHERLLNFLSCANHKPFIKTFNDFSLKERGFATDKAFQVAERPVFDLQSLSKLLGILENDPTQKIIIGSLKADQINLVPRNNETLTASRQRWLIMTLIILLGTVIF